MLGRMEDQFWVSCLNEIVLDAFTCDVRKRSSGCDVRKRSSGCDVKKRSSGCDVKKQSSGCDVKKRSSGCDVRKRSGGCEEAIQRMWCEEAIQRMWCEEVIQRMWCEEAIQRKRLKLSKALIWTRREFAKNYGGFFIFKVWLGEVTLRNTWLTTFLCLLAKRSLTTWSPGNSLLHDNGCQKIR